MERLVGSAPGCGSFSTNDLPRITLVGQAQFEAQPSPSTIFPSSQSSPAVTMPLPQPVGVQFTSQPSPLTVLPSSHVSPTSVTPSPQVPWYTNASSALLVSPATRFEA